MSVAELFRSRPDRSAWVRRRFHLNGDERQKTIHHTVNKPEHDPREDATGRRMTVNEVKASANVRPMTVKEAKAFIAAEEAKERRARIRGALVGIPVSGRVQALLTAAGLSQPEAGKAIGISGQRMHLLCKRGKPPENLDVAFRIADYFGVSVEAIWKKD